MITANLNLKEKIRYAAIGEYILSSDDLVDIRTEDDVLEARNEGYQEGVRETERDSSNELEEVLSNVAKLVEKLIEDVPNLTTLEIIARLEAIENETY